MDHDFKGPKESCCCERELCRVVNLEERKGEDGERRGDEKTV